MAIDINLANLANLQNETSAVNLINANMASITSAFEECVSEAGDIPNQMESSLDMNSNRILNLPAPGSSAEPVRQIDLQNAVFGGSSALTTLALSSTTDSTTSTTGSLTTAGGAGIAKSLNVGANVGVTGNITVAGNSTVSGTSTSQMAATTIKGRPGTGTGTSSDFTIQGLTAKVSVDNANDKMLIFDNATSTLKSVTPLLIANSATAGVTSFNGQSGALAFWSPPQGRLTLATGVAVMSSTVSAASTVYYTPSVGNICPIYDGTNMVPTTFAEISQATTDTTKSPAAMTTNANYDVFVWNDAGTVRATRGPAWTSNTSRGTGAGTSELVVVKGVLLNANAITNGAGAQRGTYVGTVRSNGSSVVDYIFGGSASGGIAGSFGVWNMYNRNLTTSTCVDTGGGYSYTTNTLRQARASTANQVSAVIGLSVDTIHANYQTRLDTAATSLAFGFIGIGEDSTTVSTTPRSAVRTVAAVVMFGMPNNTLIKIPGLGYHTYAALESGDGTTATTFNTDSLGTLTLSVWN